MPTRYHCGCTSDNGRFDYCSLHANDTAGAGNHPQDHDAVNHPRHYTAHPSGVECIQITRHMGFNLGNAVKYIWRADLKHDDGGVEDLEKAVWYLRDEIEKRRGAAPKDEPKLLKPSDFKCSHGTRMTDYCPRCGA